MKTLASLPSASTQLTPPELFLHRLHEDFHGSSIVVAVARFQGCVAKYDIQQALHCLQQRHSALRVTIQTSGSAASFFDTPEPQPIPLVWTEAEDLDAWSQVALELGADPFDSSQGSLFRVHVLCYPVSHCSDILFACHHALCDGRSLLVLYSELLRLCAGETLLPPDVAGLRPLPRLPLRQGLVRPLLKEVLHRFRLRDAMQHYPLTNLCLTPLPQETLRRRIWSPTLTAQLKQRARVEETTLFGAICAAVVLSLFDWYGIARHSVKIRAPLDIRKLCDPSLGSDFVGCYSSVIPFVVHGADCGSFWELARSARQGLHRMIDNGMWAAGWRILGILLKLGRIPPIRPVFCIVNNLGDIGNLNTGSCQLSALSLTVNQQRLVRSFKIFFATVGGALNLTIHSSWQSSTEVDTLFDQILRRLGDACAYTPEQASAQVEAVT